MKTGSTSNPNPNGIPRRDPTAEVLKQEWINSLRRLENKEAEFGDRLSSRKSRSNYHKDKLAGLIDQRESEYSSDREKIRSALDVCTQDLNAAHMTCSRHCGEIGVHYVPDQTTEAEVLRVPKLSESEAARILELRNGPKLKTDGQSALKVISAILCALVSSVAWGALVCGVNLKRPLASPSGTIFALILGAATAVIVWRFLARIWSTIGSMEGAGMKRSEIARSQISALAQTMIVLAGLMALDGLGLVRANAAKAELNPIFAIPLWLALIAAGFITLAYVSGLSYSSRAEGYNDAATRGISGLIQTDEDIKKEERKRYVLVQAALDALGQVKIVRQRIEEYKAELMMKEGEFSQVLEAHLGAMPEEPTGLTREEEHELNILRDKVVIAKERYDSHVSSRGVNYVASMATESKEDH